MAQYPRVAVCLSGQPRAAKETFHLIMNNIILPNQADVFIHMNFDPNTLYMEKSHADKGKCNLEFGIDKWIIEHYQPKKWMIEPPRDYKNAIIGMSEKRLENHKRMNSHKNWTEEQHHEYITRQMYNMYYSIYKANELKELYMLETGNHYDYVFRLRFDITPRDKILAKDYNPNYIYYLDIGQPDSLISDWLNFGSNAIMNIYASIFLHLEYLNNFNFFKKEEREDNHLEPSDSYSGLYEFLLRDIMFLHKIPKFGIKRICGLF